MSQGTKQASARQIGQPSTTSDPARTADLAGRDHAADVFDPAVRALVAQRIEEFRAYLRGFQAELPHTGDERRLRVHSRFESNLHLGAIVLAELERDAAAGTLWDAADEPDDDVDLVDVGPVYAVTSGYLAGVRDRARNDGYRLARSARRNRRKVAA